MRDLEKLYSVRFNEAHRAEKDRIWQVLCEHFFQRFVPEDSVVLDIACGFGEFSRHIRARRKLALDISPHAADFLPKEVEFHQGPAEDMSRFEASSVDVCFTSNFFEHLPDKPAMDRVLQQALRVLRPGGSFMALQPNIKYAGDSYWDFYDHSLALSHLSAYEGFMKNGFEVPLLIPRFVPFSTVSSYPRHPALVWLYLKIPLVWRFLGKQFFILARKPA